MLRFGKKQHSVVYLGAGTGATDELEEPDDPGILEEAEEDWIGSGAV